MAMVRRKVALRAELEIVSAKVTEAIPTLSERERSELIALMAAEDTRADQDLVALRAEAQRIAIEEAQAQHVRTMTIPLSKSASKLVQEEGRAPCLARFVLVGGSAGNPCRQARLWKPC